MSRPAARGRTSAPRGRCSTADWADGLRDELGWLGSSLGPARDLDVLLEHVRGELEALGGGEELAGLVESLEREHEQARAAVVAALSEDRYFALLDRLEGAEPEARRRGERDARQALAGRVPPHAQGVREARRGVEPTTSCTLRGSR